MTKLAKPTNKLFSQPHSPSPFRSQRIFVIFQALNSGAKLARELASLINTSSKEILPRLKRYIIRGWVQVQKINNVNVYSLSEDVRKILKLQGSFEKVKEMAERLLGRKLDEDEVDVLKFFYELNGSYVERNENESIAEQVYYALKRISKRITLSRVTEILTELTSKKILFAYRLRNGIILKVRLNKNIL
jgi:hypothetical protein